MKNLIWYCSFFLILLMTACSGLSDYSLKRQGAVGKESHTHMWAEDEEVMESGTFDVKFASTEKDASNRVTEQTKVKPKIIKDASVRCQVEDHKEARQAIDAAISASGAYVSSEDESKSGYSWQNNMVIRVSSEKFDGLLTELEKIAIYTDHKRINAKDVTAEYIDIEARLNNRKQVEKRFQEILKQAKNIKEILQVENEIRKIREEIDAAEGRLKYLRDQVTFSTINLTYYEKLDYEAAPERSYFTKIGKAFSEGWDGFLEFTIGMMYAWPFWIAVAVGIWFLRRWWGRRQESIAESKK